MMLSNIKLLELSNFQIPSASSTKLLNFPRLSSSLFFLYLRHICFVMYLTLSQGKSTSSSPKFSLKDISLSHFASYSFLVGSFSDLIINKSFVISKIDMTIDFFKLEINQYLFVVPSINLRRIFFTFYNKNNHNQNVALGCFVSSLLFIFLFIFATYDVAISDNFS